MLLSSQGLLFFDSLYFVVIGAQQLVFVRLCASWKIF